MQAYELHRYFLNVYSYRWNHFFGVVNKWSARISWKGGIHDSHQVGDLCAVTMSLQKWLFPTSSSLTLISSLEDWLTASLLQNVISQWLMNGREREGKGVRRNVFEQATLSLDMGNLWNGPVCSEVLYWFGSQVRGIGPSRTGLGPNRSNRSFLCLVAVFQARTRSVSLAVSFSFSCTDEMLIDDFLRKRRREPVQTGGCIQ